MGGYKTVVVGTDGSDSSMRAVDRAGQLASGLDSKVIVATALPAVAGGHLHWPTSSRTRDTKSLAVPDLRGLARRVTVRPRRRGQCRGTRDRRCPVDALVDLAVEVGADLLVVGNLGLSSIAGRLLGSVPANVARRAKTDVLIVHTTG